MAAEDASLTTEMDSTSFGLQIQTALDSVNKNQRGSSVDRVDSTDIDTRSVAWTA